MFSKTVKDRDLKISEMIEDVVGVKRVDRHFRLSQEVEVEFEIFKKLYFYIKSIPVDKVSLVVSENTRPTGNRFVNFR